MFEDLWNRFIELSAVRQAFIGTLFTWGLTSLGASAVFFIRRENRKLLDVMLGFTGGVMIAASFWSLLSPAIEMSSNLGRFSFAPAAIGFCLGAVFLRLADFVMPHVHLKAPIEEAEGIPTRLERTTLLVLAITLHNIPEGLAVGVAFGAAAHGFESATVASAVVLAFGIGVQNFPEGMAVSMPMRREGFSKAKSFWYGQLSGVVEPVAGVLGAAAVLTWQPILPYALAFAAGAMIFVVVEEVIPEAQSSGNADAATLGLVAGFVLMMTLDVALG
ncbi:MAG: ZIP family metal transporter [Thermoanaerobaculia bacterium]